MPSIERGFTLLEVLVALAVLALALVALTRTAAHEIAAFDALRQRTLAGWVASDVLADIRLRPGLPATGRRQGTQRLAGREWSYSVAISGTPEPSIRRVHVQVYAGDRRKDPVVSLEGFADTALAR